MPIDPITTGIGLAGGLIGAIGKMFGRGKANRQLESLIKQNPSYQINPEAQKRLALAQTLLNARMPGAAQVERNIYTNQANRLGQLQRNATDSSQLLALGAAAQGQSNEAFQNLGIQEGQNYYNNLQNLTGAQQGMINEGDKVYNDKVRQFQDLMAIRGAQNANRQNTWGDISNLGFGLADFGMSGGFNGMGGGMKMGNLGGFQQGMGNRSVLNNMPTYQGRALPVPTIG